MALGLKDLVPAVILIAVSTITIGMVAEVLSEIQDQEGTDFPMVLP